MQIWSELKYHLRHLNSDLQIFAEFQNFPKVHYINNPFTITVLR